MKICLNKTEATDGWFSKRVDAQLKELTSVSRSVTSVTIAVVVVFTLIVLYFVAHQTWSTGFFTATFGPFEMLLLYGSLIEWIIVATLEGMGRKNLSRDIDAFGGIIFVTIGGIWLLVRFPFQFAHFANVLPDFLRFLVQWISNDIARGVIALWAIVNGIAAVYYGILRVLVRKKLSKRDL